VTEPIPASRTRRAYAVGCLLLLGTVVIFSGSFFLWATRPIATEAQIQEASARVERARGERVTSCPRPVLRGVALAGDGAEGLRELAGWQEPSLHCFEYLGSNEQQSFAVLRLSADDALPFERSVAEECAGLDTAVQALLQRESGCTAQPVFLSEGVVIDMQQLELMMFILARAHIHEGRLQEGMELLLDVIRLGQDSTRGDASLLSVRVGQQMQYGAAAQLEALLARDLPWTPTMLDELARQARVLATTMPEHTAWFAHSQVWVRLRAVNQMHGPAAEFWAEGAVLDLAAADYGDTHWPECTGVALQPCVTRHREAIMDTSDSVAAMNRWRWIPGVEREVSIRSVYADRLREREAALSTAAHNEALLRALPALFLHRRMSLSGTCPTAQALQAEALAAGLADVEVQSSSEPHQPLHLLSVGKVEPLYRAHCPALRQEDEAQP
jgi:hypothetical protein